MGNTTVDPRNTTANICCSSIIINTNKELNAENNGKYTITQGDNLGISVSSLKGYKINDFGELIGPGGVNTGSKVSEENKKRYKEYREIGNKKTNTKINNETTR